MLGYLFGILITGLIITSVVIDCYKTKDELKRKKENHIVSIQMAIEKEQNSFKYEVDIINSEIIRLENRLKKK